MEDADRDRARSAHRLTLCRENFDDYVVALTAKLRSNLDADRVLSGETLHPLLAFQDSNRNALAALNVPWVPPQALFNDPVTPYVNFIRQITDAFYSVHKPRFPLSMDWSNYKPPRPFFAAPKHISTRQLSILCVSARQCITLDKLVLVLDSNSCKISLMITDKSPLAP